ncbi:hypothetical protein [Nannocystis pusilla]|uniref:Lipoprotein n=1 Tax=Nannocystis pusilla TaxID=889268 RepID=A0ABS7THU6_9BACT|nr:hypothetical protein [Nannocystis pusilla]MBZ5707790.1 hypothetical protein [Nannocystis pusilla]
MRLNFSSPIHLGLALLALAGCDLGILDPIITTGLTTDSPDTGVIVTATSTTSGDPDPETTAAPSTSGEDPGTTGDTTTSASGGNFIVPPDPPAGCDAWAQDCPSGEKCSAAGPPPFSSEIIACHPIAPDPDQLGEECEILVEGHLGPDTCDIGLYCHAVDADTGKGTCIPLCSGSPADPACGAGLTCLVLELPLCIPECDPLLQNCPSGQSCNYLADSFACWPLVEEPKQLFEGCEYVNQCEPGLMCVAVEFVTECDPTDIGCCTPYCDLDNPGVCPGVGQVCRPFFTPGDAPPGHEDVGVCALDV